MWPWANGRAGGGWDGHRRPRESGGTRTRPRLPGPVRALGPCHPGLLEHPSPGGTTRARASPRTGCKLVGGDVPVDGRGRDGRAGRRESGRHPAARAAFGQGADRLSHPGCFLSHPRRLPLSSAQGSRHANPVEEDGMTDSVYKVIELVGTSPESWEKAVAKAVAIASKSVRDLRIAEVGELDVQIEAGKGVAYRAKVKISFKYERPD